MTTILLNHVYNHDIYREITLDVSELSRYVLRHLLKILGSCDRASLL